MNIDPINARPTPPIPSTNPATVPNGTTFETGAPAEATPATHAAPLPGRALQRMRQAVQSCPAGQDPRRHAVETLLDQHLEALSYRPPPDVKQNLAATLLADPTVQAWLANVIRSTGASG